MQTEARLRRRAYYSDSRHETANAIPSNGEPKISIRPADNAAQARVCGSSGQLKFIYPSSRATPLDSPLLVIVILNLSRSLSFGIRR
jgi:hypothetical protein